MGSKVKKRDAVWITTSSTSEKEKKNVRSVFPLAAQKSQRWHTAAHTTTQTFIYTFVRP